MDKKLNLLILLMSFLSIAEGDGTTRIDQIMKSASHHKGHKKHSDKNVKKMESCELYDYVPTEGTKTFKFVGHLPYELVILRYDLKDGEKVTLKTKTHTITFDHSMELPRLIPNLKYRYFSIYGDGPIKIAASNHENCSATGCAEINGTCVHKDLHECTTNLQTGLCPGPEEIQCCMPSDTGERKMKRDVPVQNQEPKKIERRQSPSECEAQGGSCVATSVGCPEGTAPVALGCPENTPLCCLRECEPLGTCISPNLCPDSDQWLPNPCPDTAQVCCRARDVCDDLDFTLGRRDTSETVRNKRIVNGFDTNTIDHSYMAFLRVRRWHLYCFTYVYIWFPPFTLSWNSICWWFWTFEQNKCSGTVIHDTLVLTSAQCTEFRWDGDFGFGPWPILFWIWFCWSFPVWTLVDLGFDGPPLAGISHFVPWFDYVNTGIPSINRDYDVALLWIDGGISEDFQRIKVPQCGEQLCCQEVSMLGKGYSTVPLPFTAFDLYKEYQANVIPPWDCPVTAYPLTPRMFCTRKAAPPPPQTICYGDVGGPVLCNYNQCDYQIGVISWKDNMWSCSGGDENVHAKLRDPEICDFVNTKKQCVDVNPGVRPSNANCPW